MPGTCENVLSEITTWVKDDPRSIFCLAGTASTGKTSVAVTLCRMLSNDPGVVLGGAFFCSRSTGFTPRTDVRCIIPTLTAALAAQSPEFATALANEHAAHKQVSDQITSLLVKPLDALAPSAKPIVFVVDALDECSNHGEVAALLTAIVNFRSDVKVKFVITSQPDMHILGTSISDPVHNSILQLHTISEEEVTANIRRYLGGTLQAASADANWYTNEEVDALVKLSHGQFVFASIIASHILAGELAEGRKTRLHRATSVASGDSAATSSSDKVYEIILDEWTRLYNEETIDEEAARGHIMILHIIATVLAARTTLSVQALADLFACNVEELHSSLSCLKSVLYIPDDNSAAGVRVRHPSFSEYIISRAPSNFRISESLGHVVLAHGCLELMAKRLHFNVSQSRSSYEPNRSTKPDTITLALEYACLHWIYHVGSMTIYPETTRSIRSRLLSWILRMRSTSLNMDQKINDIFRPRLLFWLEVMSVLGQAQRAAAMLIFAAAAVQSTELSRFFRDANALVASSQEAIERSAPHIYLSALPFASRESLVFRDFSPLCAGLIDVSSIGVGHHEPQPVMNLTGHEAAVTTVSYSPDGRLIVSGSADGTVRLWDTRTAEEVMVPLRNGGIVQATDSSVWSVAFSPDVLSLASGTHSGVVYVWKLLDGHAIPQPLSGHAGPVCSVEYSPDGTLLASASDDKTLRLWKAETGELHAELRGHTARVNAVTFTPDGQMVASGSEDKTVRLWHTATGDFVRQLAHTADFAITGLCFSLDGKKIAAASGSDVIVSKTRSGKAVTTVNTQSTAILSLQFSPDGQLLVYADGNRVCITLLPRNAAKASSVSLNGHADTVRCVRFSPDCLYVISASDDRTIRIWNASWLSPLVTGHDAEFNFVVVSPDGAVIVSGSDGRSVHVWDARAGEVKLPPLLGHTDSVSSVTISSEGRLISSASRDSTVRIWDARTGKAIGKPLKVHVKPVMAVVFSPDTRWLASGSVDKTVLIWDIQNGRPAAVGPLLCNGSVHAVIFSPDGQFIAAGDAGGHLYLWHAETGKPAREPFQADPKTLHSIAFSPDGTHVVSGGAEEVGHVWHANTGQLAFTLGGHTGQISCVAYSSDGRLIGTGSHDKTVRIWDAMTGVTIATLFGHTDWVKSVAFTPDGLNIVSCSKDKTIRAFSVDVVGARVADSEDDPLVTLVSSTTTDGGWRVGPSGELLLWVPTSYRRHMPEPPCTLLIEPRGAVVKFGDDEWYRGENWTSCWRNAVSNPHH